MSNFWSKKKVKIIQYLTTLSHRISNTPKKHFIFFLICTLLLKWFFNYKKNQSLKEYQYLFENPPQKLQMKFKTFEKNLNQISFPKFETQQKITISVEGGGLQVIYSIGALYILLNSNTNILKAAGSSAGSWVAYSAVGLQKVPLELLYHFVYAWNNSSIPLIAFFEKMEILIEKVVTQKVKKDQLFVSLSNFLMQGRLASEFGKIEHIRAALLASAAIPFFTTPNNLPFYSYKNHWFLDGAMTNNAPVECVITKEAPLTEFRSFRVTCLKDMFYMDIKRLETLALQGAKDMAQILKEVCDPNFCPAKIEVGGICWHRNPQKLKYTSSYALMPSLLVSKRSRFQFPQIPSFHV